MCEGPCLLGFLRACKATENFGRGRVGGGRGTGFQPSLAALRSVSRWFAYGSGQLQPIRLDSFGLLSWVCHVGARRTSSGHPNPAAHAVSRPRYRAARVGAVFRHASLPLDAVCRTCPGYPCDPVGFPDGSFPEETRAEAERKAPTRSGSLVRIFRQRRMCAAGRTTSISLLCSRSRRRILMPPAMLVLGFRRGRLIVLSVKKHFFLYPVTKRPFRQGGIHPTKLSIC
jgi:hypothetical protein